MKNQILYIATILIGVFIFTLFIPNISIGETPTSATGTSNPTGLADGLNVFKNTNSGLNTGGTLIGYIANIIRWVLGLLGTVFFVIIVLQGYIYMTAGGDSSKTASAIGAIGNAVIGLLIIMGAFLITNYVTSALINSGGGSSTPTGTGTGAGTGAGGTGAGTGTPVTNDSTAYKTTRSINYNGVNVDVIIDKPSINEVDVLITYHGTVESDDAILNAADRTLTEFKNLLDSQNMMLVSVAHPQRNILFGDNIKQAEAAFLWVKNQASQDLGITVNKIFLAGHSQGGYLVTRLNTMHQTNGVIANAPGPLDLLYRCQLEETGQEKASYSCDNLRNEYGSTSTNPNAYSQRSLLNYNDSFKSDILFVQGLADSAIQLHSWPTFKNEIRNCVNCMASKFIEVPGGKHGAIFASENAKSELNDFISNH